MERLVIVSNRVPTLRSQDPAGGLSVALKSALEESGGLWFGWSGKVTEAPESDWRVTQHDGFSLATLDLCRAELRGYYEEFSNRTLWPVFHGRLDICRPERQAFDTYRSVNRRFAEVLVPLLKDGDTIWVQDYHLIPLGKHLRHRGVEGPLGFFLHIPFPPPQTFAALPCYRELLADLCFYDLVGFQTEACAENFRLAVAEFLDAEQGADGSLRMGDHVTQVGAFPVSLDTAAFAEMAQSEEVEETADQLRDFMGDRQWICGVERLDYTKGLAERLRAFSTALDRAPALRGQVSLIQVAAPSRESVPEYREMRSKLEALSGSINGRFGSFDWTPIHYLNRTFSQKQLAALYRVSRVGLVTPLRDGMNLVAKEYIAAQDPEDPGVLILSRFAGSAQELTEALLVNPFDISSTAEAIQDALEMPLAERRRRWRQMKLHLDTHDVHAWRNAFLQALAEASTESSAVGETRAA